MKVIIIKKWADLSGHRSLCIGWFFYHFLMFCLVIINLLFFICNFKNLKFTPTDTSALLLTFVGFLFAFAGINIYSIFNTNLEAEKNSLQQLRDDYEKKLEETLSTIEFSKSLIRLQVLSQLIVDPPIADFQFQENIERTKQLFFNARDFVVSQRGIQTLEQNENPENELKMLASGIKSQISLLLTRIEQNRDSYYSNFSDSDSINAASAKLQELYELVEAFEDGTIYTENVDETKEKKEPTLSERIKEAIHAVIRIFKPPKNT